MSPNTNPMPLMTPVQLDLAMPGCPSALEEAWNAHRQFYPDLTLQQALDRPLLGRLLRAQAACIERMRNRASRRRIRRLRR